MPYIQNEPQGAKVRRDGPILLIDDSRTFASILTYRFKREVDLDVVHCSSMDAARQALERGDRFSIAVVGLNLPGSPHGEVVDLTMSRHVPTIVFTATFDLGVRERILDRRVVDYVLKDSERACDTIVQCVKRTLANRDRRVLIAHHDTTVRNWLVDFFRSQLFSVSEALNGTTALLLAEQFQDIELVICAHNLPDMEGSQLARRLRRKVSEDRTRIMGVFPSSDRIKSVGFLKAGGNDVVYEPLLTEEVQCRVNHNIDTLAQIKQLRQAASSDYLTGLFNRRHFYTAGKVLIDDCLDNKEACGMAIIDIDHFKRLNEKYGHDFGDSVLVAMGARLMQLVDQEKHLLCRLGGEEFGLLLKGMDGEQASDFCEMIREELGRLHYVFGDEDIAATVSIGLAEVQARETFINYVNAADQYLFMAKQSGRDRVFSDHFMVRELESQVMNRKRLAVA
ncbi:GGDEF domain-containing response regulator [Rhizobium oryzicola]|uniref:diguanylate cyclase n=1 Tax=Rhizobium oryzicola TaxID=1232668 RepID=A0ABT8T271_9HYPH|nr:diguanylate cyclase [Rhizobium oryzicola]MDO1584388.1 diguanylate cyclase [Rhizobium oryzicola]